jgi:hypothetical protein
MRHGTCFALALFLLVPANQLVVADTAGSLTSVQLNDIPLNFENVPLTNALSQIGLSVVNGNVVLFGVEVILEDGREPLASVRIPAGSTLSDALIQLMQAVPGYTFIAVDPHFVNVFPRDATSDPDDLLNLPIPYLKLQNVSPSNFLSNPARYVPELKAALNRGKHAGCEIGPGLSDKGPGIALSLSKPTLREAMNRVSQASISLAQHEQGPAFGWVYLRERFPSAAHPANAWRVHDIWRAPKNPLPPPQS